MYQVLAAPERVRVCNRGRLCVYVCVYVIQKVYKVLVAPELVQIFALLLDLGRRQLLRLEPFHKLLLANNEILQMLANFELFTLTLSRQLLSLLLC